MDKAGKFSLIIGLGVLVLIGLFAVKGGDYVIWGGPDCEVGEPCLAILTVKGIENAAIYHSLVIVLLSFLQTIFAFKARAGGKKLIFTKVFALLNIVVVLMIGTWVFIYAYYIPQSSF